MNLVKEIYTLIDLLPKEERYGIGDQMRRAAVSIPSNIAEGYDRNTTAEYIHYLTISRGSKSEIETQIYICIMLNYFSKEDAQTALQLCKDIGKMLNALINKLKLK